MKGHCQKIPPKRPQSTQSFFQDSAHVRMFLFINRVRAIMGAIVRAIVRAIMRAIVRELILWFNVLGDIHEYEPMKVENTKDLYETTEFEWHHWKEPGTNERLPEPEVKKLLDLKSYQAYRQILENNQPEAEAQITVGRN